MNIRNILYPATILFTVAAVVLVATGMSARELVVVVTDSLGPVFGTLFVLNFAWGVWAIHLMRSGDRQAASRHLPSAIETADECSLQGTVAGILIAVGALGSLDMSQNAQILQAIPMVLKGVGIGMGTTLAFRLQSWALRMGWRFFA